MKTTRLQKTSAANTGGRNTTQTAGTGGATVRGTIGNGPVIPASATTMMTGEKTGRMAAGILLTAATAMTAAEIAAGNAKGITSGHPKSSGGAKTGSATGMKNPAMPGAQMTAMTGADMMMTTGGRTAMMAAITIRTRTAVAMKKNPMTVRKRGERVRSRCRRWSGITAIGARKIGTNRI